MPPITTVPPFSTSTSVMICLVSIEGPASAFWPTLSLWTLRFMITLSSGVTWGLTFNESVAFLNETLVAPLEVACWYGISVPCSMVASTWSPVMTRGLEMILPLPSACSAVSSRLRNFDEPSRNSDSENAPGFAPASPGTGRFTESESVNGGAVAIWPVWKPGSVSWPPARARTAVPLWLPTLPFELFRRLLRRPVFGESGLARRNVDDVARLQHGRHASRRSTKTAFELRPRPFHFLEGNDSGLARLLELAGRRAPWTNADNGLLLRHFEHDGKTPRRDVGPYLDAGERLAPIAGDLDVLHRAAPAAAPAIEGDEAVDQRFARGRLQSRIERGAHGETAAVKLVLTESVENLAAHFLGEILRGEDLRSADALDDAERLRLRGLALLLGGEAIL